MYRPSPVSRRHRLSRFEKQQDGTLEVPMPVGLVGGATRAHPVARAVIQLLGVTSAVELAEVIVSVGLAQNLAACRALAAEGIQHGHMRLHARTVAASAGARPDEVPLVAERLVREGRIQVEHARVVLASLREG